ncbi:hypothetical protein BANRA_02416 [Escherichia coli]|nr:hypothetical protein BANRA_02416 [Escherichia coli]
MGIILVVYYPIYHVLKATYQIPSFQMEKLIIYSLKSNIFGASFTNTRIKICSVKILCGRWTTQLVNKHLGYRYTGVFKTLASIDDKPSRFEILIPLIQTLVRDNVKLNNDVYKELKKFMHDYDKTSQK